MTATFTLAAVVSAALILPAQAQWNRIGSVTVSPGPEQSLTYSDFGGPVERLYLDANRSDIYCGSIRAQFGNGDTRNLFSGTIDRKDPRIVDLPGEQRNIRRLDFQCRALERTTAEIQISADVGRHRDTWRRHPDFLRLWAVLWGERNSEDRDDRDGRQ